MDVASLILGVATVFNAIIEDLEYVQLSRAFGTDFETSLLKLDCAKLRLSRWGESLGLNSTYAVQSLGRTTSPVALTTAERLLGQTQTLLNKAKEATDKANKVSPEDPNLQPCDSEKDLGPAMKFIHEKVSFLANRRQKATAWTTRAKWVLLEVKTFNRLMEDIKSLTDSLVDLFPAAKREQARLCETNEVYEFSESLRILKDISESRDKVLDDLLAGMLSVSTVTNTWQNTESTIGGQQQVMHGNISMGGGLKLCSNCGTNLERKRGEASGSASF